MFKIVMEFSVSKARMKREQKELLEISNVCWFSFEKVKCDKIYATLRIEVCVLQPSLL